MDRVFQLPKAFFLAICFTLLGAGLGCGADDKKDKDNDKDDDSFAEMIGKTAPNIDGEFTLNGKASSIADLKGKVVLVDFWAVWCGPCVATFPHLRDWQKEFGPKGLEIVGVTTYYEKLGFDKDKGKLKRLDEKMTKEEEQDMLKDFAAHHKLEHRLMVLPKEKMRSASEDYKVRGIPHAVLIDRKGNVRLVKVGASEDNTKELEETIKKLIDEK